MGDITQRTYEISRATNRPRGPSVSEPVTANETVKFSSYEHNVMR